MREHYLFGKAFRERYGLTSMNLSDVVVLSSTKNRTLRSAVSFL